MLNGNDDDKTHCRLGEDVEGKIAYLYEWNGMMMMMDNNEANDSNSEHMKETQNDRQTLVAKHTTRGIKGLAPTVKLHK